MLNTTLNAPACDLSMAAQFLTKLGGKPMDSFTFQTFSDKKCNSRPQILHGTFMTHSEVLEGLNRNGQAVFVTVNKTDLQGRKVENIKSVRALFADFDTPDTGLDILAACGLVPHIIVESSHGKYHAYWCVSDCGLDEFKPIQKAIAEKLGSDPAINDLPRVLRLPGFLHQKSDPFLSNIHSMNDLPLYTVKEIQQGLGVSLGLPQKVAQKTSYKINNAKSCKNSNIERIRSALFSIPGGLAENRDTWKDVAMALHSESDALFDDFLEWSEKAKNHDANACGKLWDSFSQKPTGGITIGTLFYLAKTQGNWKETSYISERLAEELLTDVGNGHRLVRNNDGNIRYCKESKAWLFWDRTSGRWEYSSDLIMRLAEDTTFKMLEEAAEKAQSGNSELSIATFKHAMKSQSLKSLKNQVEHAQSVQGVAVGLNQLDANPYLLCVLNGTINLKTGLLRDAKREDLITKQAHVIYDSTAQCATWLSFLERIFAGDSEMISFVQRAIGYSLTGLISEQVLFLAHGFGANGKSVLLNVIAGLLGDHAANAQADSLMAKRDNSGINNDIARLRGARFVSTSETEDGKRFAEAQLKQLTGGDLVTARFLYGEYFEFKPAFKVWMAANHKPIINGDDLGIWRRIILIPFNVTIPEGERDGQLINKLSHECPGILNWALQGCLDWQRVGLSVPVVVRNATESYKQDMDSLGQFLDECCEIKPSKDCSAKALYTSYKEWAEANGLYPLSAKRLGQKLVERGFKKRKSSDIYYEGLQLLI